MVSTPPMPQMPQAPQQKSEEEVKQETQQQALEDERKRMGRQETILTSATGDTSNVTTRKKTLLGE